MQRRAWRFIYTGHSDPYLNMAVDEALLCSVQKGSPPVLRLYEWVPAAVSIGYFQAIEKTVDAAKCAKAGVRIVRRITGGRAVLHDKELTYSFSGSSGIFPELGNSVSETYKQISKGLLSSLSILGIEAQWIRPPGGKMRKGNVSGGKGGKPFPKTVFNQPCFSSISRYEICYQGSKLIGSAQRRFGQACLQHGSILLEKGELRLTDFLPTDSLTGEVIIKENSTNLEEIAGGKIEIADLVKSVQLGFSRHFEKDFEEDSLTSEELSNARRLMTEKYSNDCWNSKY